MSLNRRTFLKYSALVSASALMPEFLRAAGTSLFSTTQKGRVLVVIQLSGGNDGLNCVVPFRNDLYHKARPSLGLKRDETIPVDGDAGLHPALIGLADLYNNGELGILSSVGYPNPNRSHFRSMDIWQSASDEKEILNTGWIGRYLDAACNGCAVPHTAVELDDTLSLTLKGDMQKGMAFRNPEVLYRTLRNPFLRELATDTYPAGPGNDAVGFLHKTLVATTQSADYIYTHSKTYSSKTQYPANDFGQRMKTIATLIGSGSETLIYYVSLPGFDTHAFQPGQHQRVLNIYNDALLAFCKDLKSLNRFKDTLILTFSEFGRRVEQNASKGTDHGAANTLFLAGGALKKSGMLNALPDLKNLDNGDIIHTIDFRSVYATILEKFLDIRQESVLHKKFDLLDFIS